jgi:signal transduction histidine kinase/ligand-binding sensor domain-containing protein
MFPPLPRIPPTVLVLLLMSIGGTAQYRFDNWTTKDGLPQNTVAAITQTPDGYLWLATADGLVRFDGVRFTVFDKRNSPGITSNRFLSLYCDDQGSLWAGTEVGLTRLMNGEFRTFTMADGLPHNNVGEIQKDDQGRLTVTTHLGLACLSGERFEPCHSKEPYPYSITYWSRSGDRFTFDKQGVHRFSSGKTTDFPVRWLYNSVPKFAEDSKGAIWLGTPDALYQFIGDKIIRHSQSGETPVSQFELLIIGTFIGMDAEGNFWWFPGKGKGLQIFNPNSRSLTPISTGWVAQTVMSFFGDREGSVWIGTNNIGLFRVTKQFISVLSPRNGSSANIIYPVLEDSEGRIWFGGDQGVDYFKDGVVHKGIHEPFGIAQSLYEDRDKRLWVGYYAEIGYLKDGKFTHMTDQLGSEVYSVIHQDASGAMWFGTDNGLIYLKDGKIDRFTTDSGLPHNWVKDIYEDRNGTLWFATYGGLVRLENGKFTTFTEREGLASNSVRTITRDENGALWIGSYDGGITRLKDNKFTKYTAADGLSNNGAFRLLDDGRGNFWVSSNRGIYRLAKQQLNDFAEGKLQTITSIAYGSQDGMLNTECNGGRQPAGIKARDGRLWFPTQEGVVIVDPSALPFNSFAPPVAIEQIKIDNKNVSFADGLQIRMLPGQANLEIAYTGMSLLKPDQTRFKYKLTGLSDDWIDAGTRRTAYFSYLPPGDYTFTIIAANSDGVWNTTGQSIRLTVVPPFYRTWWFVSLLAFGLAALALVVYRTRVNQLQREKARQQDFSRRLIDLQENERKRIAGELHDGLSQNLVIIRNRAMISLQEPEDSGQAFDQLEEIAEAATQSLSEVREIAYNLRPFQIDRLGLTKSIEALARKANTPELEVSASVDQIDGLLSPEMEINLYRVVQEGLNNIIKHSAATKAGFEIRHQSDVLEITIQDNGKGFEVHEPRSDSANGTGFGLLGMTERARILGCVPVIESAKGDGTKILLRIALERS